MSTPLTDPERVPVRPRVLADGSVPTLLEDAVQELLATGREVEISLCGAPGAGKSTALRHLATVFGGDPRVKLVDDDAVRVDAGGAVVTVFARCLPVPGTVRLRLAPWSDDECVEYLMARHPRCVAEALARWRAGSDDVDELRAWPGACVAVLDVLATRDDVSDPLDALGVFAAEAVERCPNRPLRAWAIGSFCDGRVARVVEAWPLARSDTVRAVLAAPALLDEIESGGDPDPMLPLTKPRLRRVAARMLLEAPGRSLRFAELLGSRDAAHDAALLSLLAAAFPGFQPSRDLPNGLARAWAPGVDLRGRTIGGSLERAHLASADLRGARLEGCTGRRVVLRGARLERAVLAGASLPAVELTGVLARQLDATGAGLMFSDLRGARLDEARLHKALLHRVRLAGASLCRADLAGAELSAADVGDAKLSGANLGSAGLGGCDLRRADLRGAILDGAFLMKANLESVDLPELRAVRADFRGARLTGSRLRRAHLSGACLSGAELAAIDWEGADLRGADLRAASFHMGSSRSGLVSSPIASEGSRTGFYTDEALDDAFATPEDVRKANLRGADLRGAKIHGTDFYLVDLREARLDVDQLEWVRRCRAILDRE